MAKERCQKCILFVAVLNNDSVEFREEYDLTDVIRSLASHGWVIAPEEQV